MENWLFQFLASNKGVENRFLCRFDDITYLLIALVTCGEPTPSKYFMHDVGTPKGQIWGINGRCMVRPGIPPLSVFSCPLFLMLPKSR